MLQTMACKVQTDALSHRTLLSNAVQDETSNVRGFGFGLGFRVYGSGLSVNPCDGTRAPYDHPCAKLLQQDAFRHTTAQRA